MSSKELAQEILVALESVLAEDDLVQAAGPCSGPVDGDGYCSGHVDFGELGERLAERLTASPVKEARALGKELALISHLPKETGNDS